MSFRRSASRISFFASISYVVDYSFQLVDIFWVAKIGLGAPTAIAIISSVFFLVLALNEIIGVSTVPLFSQAVGSGDHERAGLMILQSIMAKLVLGLLMVLSFAVFLNFLAPLYDVTPETADYLHAYGGVIWMSLVLVPVYSTMMTALRTIGEESKTAWISGAALLLNALLNPVFIFGVGQFDGLGIAGAAWATVFAQLFAMTTASYFLRKNRLGIEVFAVRHMTWQSEIYFKLVLIGLPVGGVMILYNLEQAAITALVTAFPAAVSDGYGIGARIFGFLFMANFGIAVGVSVTVGHYIGREELDVVQDNLPGFVLLSVSTIFMIAAVVFFTGFKIMSLFTENSIAIATGGEYLRYMAVAICLLCTLYSINGAFEGSGRNLPILFVALCMYLGVEFPLIYYFTHSDGFELADVWIAVIAASLFGAIITSWLFHRGWWKPHRQRKEPR
tara:strand:+ start:399 stop:1739 length:1341 start_codon:yes stop_codon:yes gene_type:complete